MTTMCEDCQHVHKDTEKQPPWRWMCVKHPRVFDGFVSTTERTTAPYLFCKDVNGGACPLFKRRTDKQPNLDLGE